MSEEDVAEVVRVVGWVSSWRKKGRRKRERERRKIVVSFGRGERGGGGCIRRK